MHLSIKQEQTFFALFNSLIQYANESLHISDEPDFPWPKDTDSRDIAEVASHIWSDTSIIDSFIQDRCASSPKKVIKQLKQWKYGIADKFILVKHETAGSLFMSNDCVFAVTGLSREISEMIPDVPEVVDTIILPFDGRIVYAVNFFHMNVQYGPGFISMMEDEFDKATENGKIIATARDLIAEYPAYVKRSKESEERVNKEQAEMKEKEKLPVPDTHIGALSGLSEEERKAAILEHDKKVRPYNSHVTFHISLIARMSIKENPETGFEACLMHLKKDELQSIAKEMNLKKTSQFNKSKLSSAIATEFRENPEVINDLIEDMWCGVFFSLKNAFESSNNDHSGAIVITFEDDADLEFHQPRAPFSFLFGDYKKHTFVVPEEINQALSHVDWDELSERKSKEEYISKFIIAQCELCGVVNVIALLKQFDEHMGRDEPNTEDARLVLKATHTISDSNIFFPGSTLIDGIPYITTQYLDPLSAVDAGDLLDLLDKFEEEDLDGFPEPIIDTITCMDILNEQDDKPARVLTKEELAQISFPNFEIFDLIKKNPSVMALREYLDTRVPDGGDDYHFADEVVDEFISQTRFNNNINQILQGFFDSNVLIPHENEANKVITLIMEAYNNIPLWENNGWTPYELREQLGGFDLSPNKKADGKKVGRNDPCPCGSGKKYKKCCGR